MKVKFIPDLQKKKKKQKSHESDTFFSGEKSSKINVSDVAVLMKKKQGRLQLFKLKARQKKLIKCPSRPVLFVFYMI